MKNLFAFCFLLTAASVIAPLNPLYSQYFNEKCRTIDPEIGDEKPLCDQFPNFTPDRTINGSSVAVTLSSLNLPSNFLTGENIAISGTFIIDDFLYFSGCNVRMGSNAEIIVQSGYYFGSLGSKFFSCTQMWEGVTINEGAWASVYNSEFEDAENTFVFDDNTYSYLYGNIFNRNFISIRNRDGSLLQPGPLFLYFGANTFDCDSELRAPRTGEISFAGIRMDQCATTIGSNFASNTFQNLRYGIYSNKSSLIVQNCIFDNMMSTNSDDGVGIYCEGGTLDARGAGKRFEDCQRAGISTSGTVLTVKDYIFQGAQEYGIASSYNLAAQKIMISNNTFNLNDEPIYAGISLINRSIASGNVTHNEIKSNTINISVGSDLFGIFIGAEVATDNMKIQSNTVNISSSGDNIQAFSIEGGMADRFYVTNNTVNFNSSNFEVVRYGIAMFFATGEGHGISYNHVIGSGTHNPGQCGIHLEHARNIYLCGNEVDHTQRGFHCQGDNSPAYLTNNEFNAHERGLYIQDDVQGPGAIGLQLRRSNTWSTTSGDYTLWAAHCISNPNNSRIIVESTSPSILPPLRSPGGSIWFNPIVGSTNNCAIPAPDNLTELDSTIIDETLFDSITNEAIAWGQRLRLYTKLLRYPDMVEEGTAIDTFYTDFESSTVGEFANIDQLFFEALQVDSASQAAIDTLQSTLAWLQNSLIVLDNSFGTPTDSLVLDTAFADQKQLLLDSLLLVDSLISNYQDQITDDRSDLLDDLLVLNNNISVTETYEVKLQLINKFAILMAAGVEFGSTAYEDMYDEISAVAALDPLSAGISVKKAKKLLPLCEQFDYYSDSTGVSWTSRPGSGTVPVEQVFDGLEFEISPNPASSEVAINFNLGTTGELILSDINGVEITRKKVGVKSQKMTLSVNGIPAGIYFVILHTDNGQSATQKLLINK